MKHLRELTLLLASVFSAQGLHCPDAWIQNGDMCYVKVRNPNTFENAQASCERLGGDLTSIPQEESREFLKKTFDITSGTYWIGIRNDLWLPKVQLKWNDGNLVKFRNWAENQPNGTDANQCVEISLPLEVWSVASCHLRRPYFCSRSADSTPKAKCPEEWIAFQDKCYNVVHDGQFFSDAEDYCLLHGGHLASINNEATNEFFRSVLLTRYTDYWIGLTSEDWNQTPLYWTDSQKVTYTNWRPDEPDNVGVERCASYLAHSGQWRDINCNIWRYFVCAVPEEIDCGQEVDLLNEQLSHLKEENLNLNDEISNLKEKNSKLTSESTDQEDEITQLQSETAQLNERNSDQQTQLSENKERIDQQADEIAKLESDLKECQGAEPVMEGWYAAGNGKQYIVTNKRNSWGKSKALCEKMGGTIATEGMRDLDLRREILREFSPKRAWIGLTDPEGDLSFNWVDGVAGNDDNIHWKKKQPSGNEKEKCALVVKSRKYLTEDFSCGRKWSAICEATES